MEGNVNRKDDQTLDVQTGNIPSPVQTRNPLPWVTTIAKPEKL